MATTARKTAPPRFTFNGKNPRAQAYAAAQAARMVTRVSEQTRQALRALVVRSIREGITADDTSDLVRDLVGLTERDAGAVYAYGSRLAKEGVLNRSNIGRLVYEYSQRLMRARSVTIARTEIMGALNAGALVAADQAVEAGLLDPQTAVKLWLVSKDEIKPPCPVCLPLDHVEVPLFGKFHTATPSGRAIVLDAPPAHPRCRCSFAVLPESRKKRRAGA